MRRTIHGLGAALFVAVSFPCRNEARTAGATLNAGAAPTATLNIGSTTTGVAVNKFNEGLPLVKIKTQAQSVVCANFGDESAPCTVEVARVAYSSMVCDAEGDLGKSLTLHGMQHADRTYNNLCLHWHFEAHLLVGPLALAMHYQAYTYRPRSYICMPACICSKPSEADDCLQLKLLQV
jgi:hypothetical protein